MAHTTRKCLLYWNADEWISSTHLFNCISFIQTKVTKRSLCASLGEQKKWRLVMFVHLRTEGIQKGGIHNAQKTEALRRIASTNKTQSDHRRCIIYPSCKIVESAFMFYDVQYRCAVLSSISWSTQSNAADRSTCMNSLIQQQLSWSIMSENGRTDREEWRTDGRTIEPEGKTNGPDGQMGQIQTDGRMNHADRRTDGSDWRMDRTDEWTDQLTE